jgi:hypothetical protein
MIQNRQFKDELAELHGRIHAFLDHPAVLAGGSVIGVKVSININWGVNHVGFFK